MKFLVDAQLPRRLALALRKIGHDVLHTLDLPEGNRTSDAAICEFCERDQRAVITKDADFVNSHILNGQPSKLVLVSTGNITNAELEASVLPQASAISDALAGNSYVEISRQGLVIH